MGNNVSDRQQQLQREEQPSSGHVEDGQPVEELRDDERDVAYTLLSSRRRRNVLHALSETGGESTVAELARQLAAWETSQPPEAISSKERKRTYTALRQTHLPRLAKHGIVEYDRNRGTVSLTEEGRAFRPYLWPPLDDERTLLRFGVVAGASTAIVWLLAWLGVYPFGMLGGFELAGVVTAAFTAVAVGAYLRYRPAKMNRRALEHDTAYESDRPRESE